jgi:hypothetical protein
MRKKDDSQFLGRECSNTVLLRRRGSPHDSRTAINQIRPIIHDDCDSRT